MSAMLDTAVETTEVNFSVSPVAKAFSIFSVWEFAKFWTSVAPSEPPVEESSAVFSAGST